MDTERHPIGETAGTTGISPRMLRYLEDQGVLRPDRVPGPQLARRHFPPHEVRIARAAAAAMEAGASTGTLASLRALADRHVARTRAGDDPLGWYALLVHAAAIEAAARAGEDAPPAPPARPPHPPGSPVAPSPRREGSDGAAARDASGAPGAPR